LLFTHSLLLFVHEQDCLKSMDFCQTLTVVVLGRERESSLLDFGGSFLYLDLNSGFFHGRLLTLMHVIDIC